MNPRVLPASLIAGGLTAALLSGCSGTTTATPGAPRKDATRSATASDAPSTGGTPTSADDGSTVAGITAGTALIAQQVLDQFAKDDLDFTDEQDETAQRCVGAVNCTSYLSSDVVSVLSFPDDATADAYAAGQADQSFVAGNIVLSFTGAAAAIERTDYEAALRELLNR